MQYFFTTLQRDLVYKKNIFLPAGNAKFTLIDVRDIGDVAARIIVDPATYFNKSYGLTCNDKLTFKEMAKKLTEALGTKINYESPGLFKFFLTKRMKNVSVSFILIMIMLHYLPRFQKEPIILDRVEKITGIQPTTFD